MCKVMDSSHAKTEATSKRASVTRETYANECLTARYRSPLIKTVWTKETETPILDTAIVKFGNVHDLLESSSTKSDIIKAMKAGCARTPTKKSVKASKASPMLDLWALRREFILTANITSAFKAAVRGNVRMWTTVMIMRKAWVRVEGWWSLPPIAS